MKPPTRLEAAIDWAGAALFLAGAAYLTYRAYLGLWTDIGLDGLTPLESALISSVLAGLVAVPDGRKRRPVPEDARQACPGGLPALRAGSHPRDNRSHPRPGHP